MAAVLSIFATNTSYLAEVWTGAGDNLITCSRRLPLSENTFIFQGHYLCRNIATNLNSGYTVDLFNGRLTIIKTVSSRKFNQDVGGTKRAASEAPVFITDRGEPSHVLMSIGDYRKLTDTGETLGDRFRRLDEKHPTPFDWKPPKLLIGEPNAVKFDK